MVPEVDEGGGGVDHEVNKFNIKMHAATLLQTVPSPRTMDRRAGGKSDRIKIEAEIQRLGEAPRGNCTGRQSERDLEQLRLCPRLAANRFRRRRRRVLPLTTMKL